MALISCPECESPISEKASRCSSCGFPLRREIWKDKILVWGSRLGMGIAALVIVAMFAERISQEIDDMNSVDRSGAISTCIDSIGEKRTLATSGRLEEPHFGSLGSGQYLVDGKIRLAYSGGLRRTDSYRCVMEQDSAGYWTAVSAEIR